MAVIQLPPIESPKKRPSYGPKIKLPRAEPPPLHVQAEESPLPKSLVQEIKKIYDYKRENYIESLIRTHMTPKKLMEVRNRNMTPSFVSPSRDKRIENLVRDIYRPSSLKPYTAQEDEKRRSECVQNLINNIAYL